MSKNKINSINKTNFLGKGQNPKIIIILGPPGSGKGTQSELLTERFDLYRWETSNIIGRILDQGKKDEFIIIDGKKYPFEEQREIRRKGLLWDGNFVFYFTKKKIEELAKEKRDIVMSGSLRVIAEAKSTVSLLKKLYGTKNIIVIALKLSPEETIKRNTRRRECQLVSHSILFSKETANLEKCPLDGSKLMLRKDDNEEVIKRRLKEYEEKTFPMIKFLKKQGLNVKEIKGGQSVSDVFQDILKALK